MKTVGYKIILHTNKGQAEETVRGSSIQVGRNLSADLPIMASGVSRSHLEIFSKGGDVYIKDLGSTNGTYIKGEKIEPHKETLYVQGERLSLGQAGCFIRVEALQSKNTKEQQDIQQEPVSFRSASDTQIKKSKEDTGIFGTFFGSPSQSGASDLKEKKRAEKYMLQAEKLVKKRIKDAEDSIRKGIQNARNQAQDILLDAKKDSERLRAETEIEQHKIILEAKKEGEKIKENAVVELENLRSQISRDKQEGESVVDEISKEISSLKKDRIQYENQAQEIYEEKLSLEQEKRELEIKLAALKDSHASKVEALNMEINFLDQEAQKQKEKNKELKSDQESLEIEHSKKLENLKMDYEDTHNSLEKDRADLSRVHKEKEEISEDLRNLRSQVNSLYDDLDAKKMELEEVVNRKGHLDEEVSYIELQAKNEAKRLISEAEEKVQELLSQSKDKAEEIRVQAEVRKAEVRELEKEAREKRKELLAKTEGRARGLIEDAKVEALSLSTKAQTEKEAFLSEARELRDKAQVEYKKKMSDLEVQIKTEKKTLKEEIQQERESKKAQLEKDLAELKVTQLKEIEDDLESHKLLLEEYKENYAKSWSIAISFATESVIKKSGAGLESVNMEELREKIAETSKSIILEEDQDDENLKKILNFNPKHAAKVKRFWRNVGYASALVVLALLIFPYVKSGVVQQAKEMVKQGEKATEERVAQIEETAKKLRTFVPEKKNEYLGTYTDRVLYTQSYVENELEKAYREDWFLSLDTFFVEELILSDEAIVTFISKETNLIKDLELLRDGINAQFKEEGIAKMREAEQAFILDVKKIVKTEGKYKQFEDFKKNHFLKNHPFSSERELAGEKE